VRRRNVILIGAAVVLVLAAIIGASLVTFCCGSNGSRRSPDQQAVEESFRAFEKAIANSDGEALQTVVSQAYIQKYLKDVDLSQTSSEEASPLLGHAISREIDSITVTGDTATVAALQHEAGGIDNDAVYVSLVRQDGKWLVDSTGARTGDAKNGTVIPMELKDFSFGYDPAQFKSGQPFVIRATNTGGQAHMVVIWKITDEQLPMRAIEATDVLPPGTEKIVNSITLDPSEEGDITVKKGLQPGRYMLTCFLTDVTSADGIPHYDRGMLTEFRVSQ
jgi:uncharacterized cupredoxin-like copper-binding protein